MTETTPLAPSTAEAAVATERLAAWGIGALTSIVIGGIALVIYVPHGGHARGSSWLPEINASLNGTAAILLSTGYVLIRRHHLAQRDQLGARAEEAGAPRVLPGVGS